ncbi:MAG: uracil-DNA glycosylase family protein, partial [Victivallales bacterium]|nr:uracil-DNA glycosylase family protein [Victivallales bacterium]
MNTEKREHAFEPVFSETSTRLVLGTMPSPQSVKHGFYYSHPQNRFWPLMAELFNAPKPLTPEEKTQFVLQRDIALWDVLAVCDIAGASDAS